MNSGNMTPIELCGHLWLKRDDLFTAAGVPGGKARTCWALAQGATGLTTAGSRQSPQVNIVAHVARCLGIPCRVHIPHGAMTPELHAAASAGAELVRHSPGYNTVIVSRSRKDAAERGWTDIPFGMECAEAVTQTRGQVPERLPFGVTRVVVPVGSGMSLAGILHGMKDNDINLPVVGVVVGASPIKRLDRYAPVGWRDRATLIPAGMDYHSHARVTRVGGVRLDPVYEAKCLPHTTPGDLLWCVGIRATATV